MTMPDGSGAPPGGGYTNAGPSGPQYTPPPAPPYYAAPPAPPAKTSGRRTGIVILVTLAVIVLLIVGGLALIRDRISGDVNSLQVGDCIDDPGSTTEITDIQHQPCTEPHDGEVFALVTHPAANGAAYPGKDAFRDLVVQQCLPQVQVYTGRTLDEIDAAGLTYAWFYPTTDSWTNANDRGITCYIARSDETKMTGSVKSGGSSASP